MDEQLERNCLIQDAMATLRLAHRCSRCGCIVATVLGGGRAARLQ